MTIQQQITEPIPYRYYRQIFPLNFHFLRFTKCQTRIFHYKPFLDFFSHLSSLLSSSLKRLCSSSFSRISSHCLRYCCRGFSGKEVWSAFTPPSRAPPCRGEENGKYWGESPGQPAMRKHLLETTAPKSAFSTPILGIRVTWGPFTNFSSSLPQFLVASIAPRSTLPLVRP